MTRRFFQLRDDMTVPDRWHLREIVDEAGREPLLLRGQRYEGKPPLSTTVQQEGTALDFTLTSFAVPVASRALAEAIASVAGQDVQLIPLHVDAHPPLFVLNALRVIRCLDETRSEFLKWTTADHRADKAGQYRMVTKLVVDPAAIPEDAHFFRIQAWTVALIVSETVKSAMEQAGCKGACFIPV